MQVDSFDLRILQLLQSNAQLTYREIAQTINLSVTPVHDRIKRLEREGYIAGYVTLINQKKLGHALTVYCQVTLIKQTKEVAEKFNEAVRQMPQILECHFVSGSFDYLMKIVVPDMESYHQFHQEQLSTIEGVSVIHSYFVLSEVKSGIQVPISAP